MGSKKISDEEKPFIRYDNQESHSKESLQSYHSSSSSSSSSLLQPETNKNKTYKTNQPILNSSTKKEPPPTTTSPSEYIPLRTNNSNKKNGSNRQIKRDSERITNRNRSRSLISNVVSLEDDSNETTLSLRVILLGFFLGCTGAAVGQIFFFKSNGIGFNNFLIILVSYPMGKFLEKFLPNWTIRIGHNDLRIRLNPGRFTLKEHLLIGVLASGASGSSYAGDIVAVQDLYYHQDIGHVGGLLLVLSTQLIGFGLAGLTYSLLVRPTNMIWPSSLVVMTMYNTLHHRSIHRITRTFNRTNQVDDDDDDDENDDHNSYRYNDDDEDDEDDSSMLLIDKISKRSSSVRPPGVVDLNDRLIRKRFKFFLIVFIGITIYQFLPTVFAPTLSSIAVLCLINNRNQFMRVLGSAYTGAGMFSLSLDWAVITSISLQTPFYSSCNFYGGLIWSMWIVVPTLWYFDFWNYQSFGDNAVSSKLFDSNFKKYNVSAVVKPDLTLDLEKYEEMGPIQLTPYFAMYYGIGFAVLTSAITTVMLFHSNDIKLALAARSRSSPDVHVEMVEKTYEQVPASWYITIGTSMALAAVYVVTFYPLQIPVWGLLVALFLAMSFTVPLGIIKATSNTNIGLHAITELTAGFLFPGKPLANIVFKVYGYMTMHQCLDLAADLKLGIYAKIPPKDMFISQILGTAIGGVVNYSFIRLVIADKRDYLDGTLSDPTGQWTGRKPELFYSGSVVWGLIGPIRFFSGKYKVLYLGIPLGFVLPFIPWYLSKRFRSIPWKYFSIPLFLHGAIQAPRHPNNIIVGGFICAFVSQFWALRHRPNWFHNYNYILSSALDAGTSVNALVVYALALKGFEGWWNSPIDSEHCTPGS